tara:strand:- start:3947 stop:10747 length:6801 start_codon:yes stop_codon:yes gene_type:complete
MSIIQENFDPDILSLIEIGSDSNAFEPHNSHFIRMVVYDEDGDIINQYYSNRTWGGKQVFWHQDTLLAYYDSDLNDPPSLSNPISDDDLQLPLYKDEGDKFYVKPNDALAEDPNIDYENGNYTLKFDILESVMDFSYNPLEISNIGECGDGTCTYKYPYFYISEISTSRLEVRLNIREYYLDDDNLYKDRLLNMDDDPLGDGVTFVTNTHTLYGVPGFLNHPTPYNMDLNLSTLDSNNSVILNYQFDRISGTNTDEDGNIIPSLIIKLEQELAPEIERLDKISIVKELYPTQIEEIIYFKTIPSDMILGQLSPKSESIVENESQYDNIQSYNDLFNSASLTNSQQSLIQNSIFSGSYDVVNVDFDEFSNHVFFGSAERKLENFYSKVKTIEEKLTYISSSLNFTESNAISNKNKYFSDINTIIQNFTPYEKWMYYDYETSTSYPNMGRDYTRIPPVSGTFATQSAYNMLNNDIKVLSDYNGLDVVYKVTTAGEDVIYSGSFATGSGTDLDIHELWVTSSNPSAWSFTPSGSIFDYNSGESLDLTNNPLGITPSQFEANSSYLVEFDVIKQVSATDTKLKFSCGNDGGDASKTFTIDSTGHYSGNIHVGDVPTENYLKIEGFASSPFSGSIDNVVVRKTQDNDGRADIFTDKYRVEDYPFSHYNGNFYMSFLAKWDSDGGYPTWENYNASGALPIPTNAFTSSYITKPTQDKDKFRHYVLQASQSYWRSVEDYDWTGNGGEIYPHDTTKWDILSGSGITGSYTMDGAYAHGQYDDYITYNTQSILPTGELFRYYHTTSSADNAPVTESYFTDIKVFKDDQIWDNANPNDVLLFSHIYSTGSQPVQEWYSASLALAKDYDTTNINSIKENVPNYIMDLDESKTLEIFLSVLGEHYDLLKVYIDNYLNLQKRDYGKNEGVPGKLLKLIGDTFGWKFVNTESLKTLMENYIGGSIGNETYEDLTHYIWKNILNNLIYIYKTKGTENSIRALLSCFGVPPEIITVNEIGGTDNKMIQESPGELDLLLPLNQQEGDITYNTVNSYLQFLNFGGGNNNFEVDWNSTNTGLTDGVEFMFSGLSTTSDEILLKSSGSGTEERWNLKLLPSASSDTKSYLEFQLNTSHYGGSAIATNKVSMSSDYLDLKSDSNNDVWNVMLQRTDSSATSSYQLLVGKKLDDTIVNYSSTSLSVTGSYAKNNYIASGSTNGNLKVGLDFTGSITEFRAFSGSFNERSFQTHIFNPLSTRGQNIRDFERYVYRYTFKGDFTKSTNTTIVNDVIGNNSKGDFSVTLSNFNNPTFKKSKNQIIDIPARSFKSSYSFDKHKVKVDKKPLFTANQLSPIESIIDESGINKSNSAYEISLSSQSPSHKINQLISYSLSDHDIKSLFGDPDDKTKSYYNLGDLRSSVLNQYPNVTNINDIIRNTEKLLPNKLFEMLEELLPVKTDLSAITLESDMLHRNKVDWGDGVYTNTNQGSYGYYKLENFDLGPSTLMDNSNYVDIILNDDIKLNLIKIDNSKFDEPHNVKLNNLDYVSFTNTSFMENINSDLNILREVFDMNETNLINQFDGEINLGIFKNTTAESFEVFSKVIHSIEDYYINSYSAEYKSYLDTNLNTINSINISNKIIDEWNVEIGENFMDDYMSSVYYSMYETNYLKTISKSVSGVFEDEVEVSISTGGLMKINADSIDSYYDIIINRDGMLNVNNIEYINVYESNYIDKGIVKDITGVVDDYINTSIYDFGDVDFINTVYNELYNSTIELDDGKLSVDNFVFGELLEVNADNINYMEDLVDISYLDLYESNKMDLNISNQIAEYLDILEPNAIEKGINLNMETSVEDLLESNYIDIGNMLKISNISLDEILESNYIDINNSLQIDNTSVQDILQSDIDYVDVMGDSLNLSYVDVLNTNKITLNESSGISEVVYDDVLQSNLPKIFEIMNIDGTEFIDEIESNYITIDDILGITNVSINDVLGFELEPMDNLNLSVNSNPYYDVRFNWGTDLYDIEVGYNELYNTNIPDYKQHFESIDTSYKEQYNTSLKLGISNYITITDSTGYGTNPEKIHNSVDTASYKEHGVIKNIETITTFNPSNWLSLNSENAFSRGAHGHSVTHSIYDQYQFLGRFIGDTERLEWRLKAPSGPNAGKFVKYKYKVLAGDGNWYVSKNRRWVYKYPHASNFDPNDQEFFRQIIDPYECCAIGRTAQFTTGSGGYGDIIYPDNHYYKKGWSTKNGNLLWDTLRPYTEIKKHEKFPWTESVAINYREDTDTSEWKISSRKQ